MRNITTRVGTSCLVFAFVSLISASAQTAAEANVTHSRRARADVALTADPQSPFWRGVAGVEMTKDRYGELVPGHRTNVRSRWTAQNVYFLFTCPYEQLHLKPNPSTTAETNFLWEWDVAEVFIGADFDNINRYREFQVSPQGEWVDLDIDSNIQSRPLAWTWNSGFASRARLDRRRKIWYGEMRIPLAQIDSRPPSSGREFRVNFYRLQGPPPQRTYLTWQPTNTDSYHTPAAFGRLRLDD